ncbi:ATP-binding protein [bacterium]|nr:MAG: ATP-binding protein [bacterium]
MLEHYPNWAQQFAEKYFSKTVNQFILHGNVHDYVHYRQGSQSKFVRLKEFLSHELFGSRDIVLFYDRSSGVTFRDEASYNDFRRALTGYDSFNGTDFSQKVPKDPVRVFALLENYVRLRTSDGKSIAVILDFAETIVPMSDSSASSSEDRNALVFLQKWSHDPQLLQSDYSLVLLTENLNDLNKNLVQSPYNAEIKIDLPLLNDREVYISDFRNRYGEAFKSDVSDVVLAQQTAGLSFVNLESLLAGVVENGKTLSQKHLSKTKKELIEAESYGLLEFVETKFGLDVVAGHTHVKQHLREAAKALENGRPDVLPMGYLVCGPVGTGKTFLVTCFATDIGVPMVKLKNFRSQWQGVTEGNLEKILHILKAMAPVAVMIDEADAYLGDRNSGGDSGVSSRVFATIASFMSNTENRGRIIWFLMTARPDLMPVDLKRQGRAEEHLALFYPSTQEERIELFTAMKKKTGLKMTDETTPYSISSGQYSLSGADMEAALTRAKFKAATKGEESVSAEIIDEVLADFIPPTYPEEIELQILSAVMECTSKSLLPEPYKSMSRAEVAQRVEELKLMIA